MQGFIFIIRFIRLKRMGGGLFVERNSYIAIWLFRGIDGHSFLKEWGEIHQQIKPEGSDAPLVETNGKSGNLLIFLGREHLSGDG